MNTKWRIYCAACWNIALSEKRTPEPWRTVVGRGRWVPARMDPEAPDSRKVRRIDGKPPAGRPSLPIDPHDEVYRHARRKVFEDCPAHQRDMVPPRKGDVFSIEYVVPVVAVVNQQRAERARSLARQDGRCVLCGEELAGRSHKRTCDGCRKPWSRMGQALDRGEPFIYHGQIWAFPEG